MGSRRVSRVMKLTMISAAIALRAFSADRPLHVKVGAQTGYTVDGSPVFPIGFTKGPPTGAKTPDGKNGFAELAENGFVFFQWLCPNHQWGPTTEHQLDELFHEANKTGIKVAISIADLAVIPPGAEKKVSVLSSTVEKYRDNPSLLLWKGADEPQWGKIPVANLKAFYQTVHRLDANHPVWITQAPRGTVADLRPYAKYYDVGAVDIYPVSYPPGLHSGIANKNLSVVGDYTLRMHQVDDDAKGLMMTLQICFSGVIKPGKTLRFPTFPEERYMSYQAIIDGARGLLYFGGNIEKSLSDEDRPYGWNWRFYRRVLEPVLKELRPGSPVYPALIAPNSSLPIRVGGGSGLEFTVREAGDYIYILAAKREGETVNFSFSGLPQGIGSGEVLYEPPRQVSVAGGGFTDWFGPNEVHVYRFRRP